MFLLKRSASRLKVDEYCYPTKYIPSPSNTFQWISCSLTGHFSSISSYPCIYSFSRCERPVRISTFYNEEQPHEVSHSAICCMSWLDQPVTFPLHIFLKTIEVQQLLSSSGSFHLFVPHLRRSLRDHSFEGRRPVWECWLLQSLPLLTPLSSTLLQLLQRRKRRWKRRRRNQVCSIYWKERC